MPAILTSAIDTVVAASEWFRETSKLMSPPPRLERRLSKEKQTMSVMTIVTLQAKPGREASLVGVVNEVAPPTRKQPGCLSFIALRAEDDSARVTVLQHWDSKQNHDRNTLEPHILRFMAAVADLLAEPPMMTWHELL